MIIWKYPLEITTDIQLIEIPKGAQILTVQVQNGLPCIWALVNPDATKAQVEIYTFDTGQPNVDTNGLSYVGTYLLIEDMYVGHVWVKK